MSDNIIINENTPDQTSIIINGNTVDQNLITVNTGSAVTTVNNRFGNVVLSSNDVGLSAVDNTSDLNKPISYATLYALSAIQNEINLLNSFDSIIESLSSFWNTAYTNLTSNSAAYLSAVNLSLINSTSGNWNTAYNIATVYQNNSSVFATNTLLQNTSALLTPLNLTNNLTSQLLLNTIFNNYQTSVATTTATLLPTSVYQSTSGSFATNTSINSLTGNWNTAYYISTAYQNTSGSFALNTSLQNTSALLTPITLTDILTSQLVTNTSFNNYKTSVSESTATLLPTSVYQSTSGSFATNTSLNAASSVLLQTSIYKNNSGNWQGTFTEVQSNSANWNFGYNSGTIYSQNSASYATYNYVNNEFLPLSGGIISGATRINNNLTVFGNLTATGTTTFANTVFSVTSSLSVVHIGSGPALWVGNNGDGDIASFYDTDQNVEVFHIGGNNGSFPNVGVKTSSPNVDFTVNGQISANNTIWSAGGNSNNWQSSFDTVNSLSGDWNSVYSNVSGNSAIWSVEDRLTSGSYQVILSEDSRLNIPGVLTVPNLSGGKIITVSPFDDIQGFYGQSNIPILQNGVGGTINISNQGVVTVSNQGRDYTDGIAIIGGGTRVLISVTPFGWVFNSDGSVIFPDNTTQTTAFTGVTIPPIDRLDNGTVQVVLSSDNLLHFPTGIIGDTLQDGGFTILGNPGSYAELASNDGNVYAWASDTNYGNPFGGGFSIGTAASSSGYTWTFGNDGLLHFPDGSIQTTAFIENSNWNSAYASTTALNISSGNWNSSFTTLCANSAAWVKFQPLVYNADNVSDVYVNGVRFPVSTPGFYYSYTPPNSLSNYIWRKDKGEGEGTRWYYGENNNSDDGYEDFTSSNNDAAYPWLASWIGIAILKAPSVDRILPKPLSSVDPFDSTLYFEGSSIYAAKADHSHVYPTPIQIGAAPTVHTHTISEVTNLQTTLNTISAAANDDIWTLTNTQRYIYSDLEPYYIYYNNSIKPVIGNNNIIDSLYSIINAGENNIIWNNQPSVYYGNYGINGGFYDPVGVISNSIIAGGNNNIIKADSYDEREFVEDVIGGFGYYANIYNASILGGLYNRILALNPRTVPSSLFTANYNTIVGGVSGLIYNGDYNFIGGGRKNTVYGNYNSIINGQNNTLSGTNSFILGSNISVSANNYTFVNNLSSQGIVAAQGGNSNNWNSTFTTLCANSATWVEFQPNPEYIADDLSDALYEGNRYLRIYENYYSINTGVNPSYWIQKYDGESVWKIGYTEYTSGDEYAIVSYTSLNNATYPWDATWPLGTLVTKASTIRVIGQPLAATGTEGTSQWAAKADHQHPYPTAVQVGAAPTVHTHVISDVTNLQTNLNQKATLQPNSSINDRVNGIRVWDNYAGTSFVLTRETDPYALINNDSAYDLLGEACFNRVFWTGLGNIGNGNYISIAIGWDGTKWIIRSSSQYYLPDSDATTSTDWPWLCEYIDSQSRPYRVYNRTTFTEANLSNTTPPTITIGSISTTGTVLSAARSDHQHSLPYQQPSKDSQSIYITAPSEYLNAQKFDVVYSSIWPVRLNRKLQYFYNTSYNPGGESDTTYIFYNLSWTINGSVSAWNLINTSTTNFSDTTITLVASSLSDTTYPWEAVWTPTNTVVTRQYSDTPLAPTLSGSAGISDYISRADHTHPAQLISLSGNNLSITNGNIVSLSSFVTTTIGDTRYSKLSSQVYNFGSGTNSIQPVLGNNIASGYFSNIAGGQNNTASGYFSNIAGGYSNIASGEYSNVAGGANNTASGFYDSENETYVGGFSTIGGGNGNKTCNSKFSVIAGGSSNIASGNCSSVAGGWCNRAIGTGSNVAGGTANTVSGNYANVGGGYLNNVSNLYSVIAGGSNNRASGACSAIVGGVNNDTKGFANTFILGSSLSASQANFTYVNNLSSQGIVAAQGSNSNNWNSAYNISTAYQGISSTLLTDAPSNGIQYARKNGAWTAVVTTSGGGGGGSSAYSFVDANFSALVNQNYLVDTRYTSIVGTLPDSPALGDNILFLDSYNNWSSKPLILNNNGNLLQTFNEPLTANISGYQFQLVYVGGLYGWKIV